MKGEPLIWLIWQRLIFNEARRKARNFPYIRCESVGEMRKEDLDYLNQK